MPNSRFFRQNLENLNEIVNGSTIPAFSTNVSIPLRDNNERIDIPILDEIASVNFYIAFRKKDQPRLKELLRAISAEQRK